MTQAYDPGLASVILGYVLIVGFVVAGAVATWFWSER